MSEPRRVVFRAHAAKAREPAWLAKHEEAVRPLSFPRAHESEVAPPSIGPAPLAPKEATPEPASAVLVSAPPPPLVEPSRASASIPAPYVETPAVPNQAILDAVRALESARAELMAHAEEELSELAIEIARALIDAELEARPQLHRHLIRAALDVLGPGSVPRVRVSHETFDVVIDALGGRSIDAFGHRVELEIDAALSGPGVTVEAGSASVDGMVATRLSRVRTALLAARKSPIEEAA